ncbi:MAG: Hsp70 family protein [Spirochaetales bacterium]|nr:Hsp70 family protein [Spirochaetales bacterium]
MTLPKSIGIKLYDDSFVPVLTEGETKNKRVVLTTGKDNQKRAVIEIYEGTSAKCSENEYLGKLSIELDRSTNKGEPAFEVNLRLDDNGVLYAKAWDQESKKESELVIENMASNRITQENLTDEEISKYEDTQVQELLSDETEKSEDHHVDSLQYENTSYKNANIYNDDDDSWKKRVILGIIISIL